MVTINLTIDSIEARSRDEAQVAVHSLVTEALSGAMGFELDDLVATNHRIEPVNGRVSNVPIEWHAHVTVTHHF
jgi:hypothetical protein